MRWVVLGDLHLDAREASHFVEARDQVRALEPDALVCLGDLGSGRLSGTRRSFEAARDYFAAFEVPYETILGNHDLERLDEFATDADVVRSFCEVFARERPYGTLELGPALGVLLSSTGFRDNRGYRHEVSIDDTQFAWFRDTLEANRDRPLVVFSHAPPLGSRLEVLQYPHLRAGNAWLNQSDRPRRFADLLALHPQVRLWFSGHNHLGQLHSHSVSHIGSCLFVHTGVIGNTTRDGHRHSRLVEWRDDCVHVDTFDHSRGEVIPDVRFALKANTIERTQADALPAQGPFYPPPQFEDIRGAGETLTLARSVFCAHRDMLVEYDQRLGDPVGVVEDWLGHSRVECDRDTLVLRGRLGNRRIEANADGYYFQVPARNPRWIHEIREAISRRVGRRRS